MASPCAPWGSTRSWNAFVRAEARSAALFEGTGLYRDLLQRGPAPVAAVARQVDLDSTRAPNASPRRDPLRSAFCLRRPTACDDPCL